MKLNTSDENLNESGEAAPAEEARQMSLMGGIVGPEGLPEASDLDFETKPKRSISHGTLLLLGVLIVASGGLYLMRFSQGNVNNANAKEVEAKIEQALAKLAQPAGLAPDDPLAKNNLNALFKDTNSIIAMFASDPSQRQVPIDYVKKNPFAMEQAREPEAAANQQTAAPVRENGARKKLAAEAQELKLQTVMKGRAGSIAVINGQFVQVGQKFQSFTIKSIEGMTVELEAAGEIFKLQMEEKPGSGNSIRGEQ
ncbi:MAG: hypothetical protein IT444_09870 [Phycisphaeraceae bacterium]|nr:hypothetical protein [Phycisphaeraceae bacterium]